MSQKLLVAALGAALLPACNASTDRALYGEGDFGTTTFNNGSSEEVVVDCTVKLDRVEDGIWTEREEQRLSGCLRFIPLPQPLPFFPSPIDPIEIAPIQVLGEPEPTTALSEVFVFDSFDIVTIEEPESVSVNPGESLHSVFNAPTGPGRWRLRYEVGFGCSDTATEVAKCQLREPVKTPAFGVEELCAVEECLEEAPVCEGPFFDDLLILPGARISASGIPREELPAPGSIGFLPFRPSPFRPLPLPVAECRRDLDTDECRWVCDDARPIPPDRPY